MSCPSASPTNQPGGTLRVQKRKREATNTLADTPDEIDSRPFAVRPANDDPFAKTTNFTPVCVLQRAQLPLAFLDVTGSGSRLFAAHVQTLESLHDNGVEGNVLVAEQKEEGRLYAVERAAKRVYALCRLGQWITKEALSRLSQGASKEPVRVVKRKISQPEGTSPWWARAAVDMPKELPQDKGHPSGLLRLAVPPLDPKHVPQLLPSGTSSQKSIAPDAVDTNTAPKAQGAESQMAESAPQEPLEELAKHYLDALYLHRTSLAYFAKGPLSRARSAFTSGVDILSPGPDLAEFLRSSILPVNVMDKKYKDHITSLIKDLPLVTPSPVKSRRKKKFKPKRDKSGLFSNEQEYLEKWWRGEELPGSMASPENTDAALRRRTPGLRSRETYLQIIVILETLYLETHHKRAPPAVEASGSAAESRDAETQDVESQAAAGTTKRKGKKALDLHSLLETLLDRLCIWQDLEAPTPAKSLSVERDANTNEPSNELRNFCVEIIVPFFMSRLPKEAALVNKKLGGPSPPSPEKRKSTSSRSKPGEPAVRSRPEKQPRKPFTRVATETLNHAARPMPGLHRSATDSALIKREDSQPALSSIPPAVPQVRAPRESSLTSYMSGQRTVDLAAKGAVAREKLRRKRDTEAQVKEAINNARKPNRPMATKEVAARADERFAQELSKNSRSTRPQHQPPSVHVAATPKRSKPVFTTQFIPASSTHSSNPSIVPSSSTRARPQAPQRIDSTPAVPQTSHRDTANARRASNVEETPSRASSSKFAFVSPSALRAAPIGLPLPLPAAVCESPTSQRRSAAGASHAGYSNVAGKIAATPVKLGGGGGRRISFGVGATPPMGALRESAVAGAPLVEATPVKKSGRGYGLYDENEDEGSGVNAIYDAWNDDDYEELA